MATATAMTGADAQTTKSRRLLGRNPIGLLLIAPYALFLFAIYLFPLIFQLFISFFDYFFTAPGVEVDRPFVGLENYTRALTDPTFLASLRHSAIFLIINVPITVADQLRVVQ